MQPRRLAIFLFPALVLAACATAPHTGIIATRWTPEGGATQPVTLSWESENDTHGRMHATLGPGGERFEGHYVRVTAETHVSAVEPLLGGWGPVWSDYAWGPAMDPWWWGPAGAAPAYGTAYYSGFVSAYTGKAVATLFGNRGDSMRCRFTLNEPAIGLEGGGVGECQTSDGGTLDAQF